MGVSMAESRAELTVDEKDGHWAVLLADLMAVQLGGQWAAD